MDDSKLVALDEAIGYHKITFEELRCVHCRGIMSNWNRTLLCSRRCFRIRYSGYEIDQYLKDIPNEEPQVVADAELYE